MIMENQETLYTLEGINKEFNTIGSIANYVLCNGICPSTKIYLNGEYTFERVCDYLVE